MTLALDPEALHESLLVPSRKSAGPSRDWAGHVSLVLVVITWVSQSEVAQHVQVDGYNEPMVIAWFNHSTSVLLFPLLLLVGVDVRRAWAVLFGDPATRRHMVWIAFIIATVFFLADWVWFIGLPRLSVAVGTVVFCTCPAWVCLISVFMGRRPTLAKLFGLVSCFGGVVVIFLRRGHDIVSFNGAPVSMDVEVTGTCFVFLSAVGYAIYQVIFDKTMESIGVHDVGTINVFMGVMGVMNFCLLWPLIFVIAVPWLPSYLLEIPEVPPLGSLPGLLINGTLAMAFNISLGTATVKMGAFKTSIAVVATIPVSMACDALLHGDRFGLDACIGSLLVLAGFLAILQEDDA